MASLATPEPQVTVVFAAVGHYMMVIKGSLTKKACALHNVLMGGFTGKPPPTKINPHDFIVESSAAFKDVNCL